MLFVYDVSVSIGVRRDTGDPHVRKLIRRLRVIKTGTEYFTVSPWPEGHFMANTDPLRIKKSNCFTDLEDAQTEANGRANELIAKLVGCIASLKADAETFDKTRISETETNLD